MRNCLKNIVLLLPVLADAQQNRVDSLKNNLKNAPDGPLRFLAARDVYNYLRRNKQGFGSLLCRAGSIDWTAQPS